MAITTYTEYKDEIAARRGAALFSFKSNAAAGSNSLWLINALPGAGVAPTTAAVPSRTIAGAFGQPNASGQHRLMECHTKTFSQVPPGGMWLCDRLSHQGGLSGTAAGAQTTNLPTAALTRYTDGVGVMAAVEIYTAIGTTATTATVAYTNQSGVGATSRAFTIGSTAYNPAGRFIPIPLDDADYGVRAVSSLTLAASTVSAAGNFGITLFRPLAFIPVSIYNHWQDYLIGNGLLTQRILDDACLFLIQTPGGANTNNGSPSLALTLLDA
jgi:hypothetical protein